NNSGKDNPSQALFHSCSLAYSSCKTLVVLLQPSQCAITVVVATPSSQTHNQNQLPFTQNRLHKVAAPSP
ncbi:hypothetical protein S83_070225, partial [Arachis hypogaea]